MKLIQRLLFFLCLLFSFNLAAQKKDIPSFGYSFDALPKNINMRLPDASHTFDRQASISGKKILTHLLTCYNGNTKLKTTLL